jgi:uncharacterized tellurite resistance protein B-like protein|tara:strand:+ start:452 stop:856 length:405 start_codon:yes stop_codon:yes gene_type:complete
MENKEIDREKLIGISALFVHAAKIDGNYSAKEKDLIINFLESFIESKEKITKLLNEAEKLENNSNQLINFTRIIKENSLESKSIIIEKLWKIILSDNNADEYESNLIRRICGLIYFPDNLSGEIKEKLISERKK